MHLVDFHRSGLLHILISDARGHLQSDLRHPKHRLLYDVQIHPYNYHYETLRNVLIELGLIKNVFLPSSRIAVPHTGNTVGE